MTIRLCSAFSLRSFAKSVYCSLLLPVVLGLPGCSITTIDKDSLQTSNIKTIAIVIGSDTRGRAAVVGGRGYPFSIVPYTESLVPLSADLENKLNGMVSEQIQNALINKGYATNHLKTIPIEWDLYANLYNSPENYTNLLQQYGIPSKIETVDAILFVEYLLRPKTWGEKEIGMLTLDRFETMYAKSKIWLFNPRTGERLFFYSVQRGYDQFITHVKPAEALADILNLAGFPARQQELGLSK